MAWLGRPGRALFLFVSGYALVAACGGRSHERSPGDGENGGAAQGGTTESGRGGASGRGGTFGAAGSIAGRGGASRGGTTGAGASGGGATGGGTGGAAGGESGAAGVGGDGDGPSTCTAPTGWPGGLERCRQGFVHRPTPGVCPLPVRDELIGGLAGNAGVEDCDIDCEFSVDECTRDADCPANGYCVRTRFDYDFDYVRLTHRCVAPCTSDDDCGEAELCACDEVVQNASRRTISLGRCISASCRTDADCANGLFCISPLNPDTLTPRIGKLEPFHCQTQVDECPGPCAHLPPDEDCQSIEACAYEGAHFVCERRSTGELCSPAE